MQNIVHRIQNPLTADPPLPEPGLMRRIAPVDSVATQTYWELRRAFLHQVIKPGQRLRETKLAEQLGISRTPVREALTRLVAEGWAEQLPKGRGVVLRDVRQELDDLYGLRQVLEGYGAKLAAARILPDELARLEKLSHAIGTEVLRAEKDAASLQRQAELRDAFHLQIAQASHSPRLFRLITTYRGYFLSSDFVRSCDRNILQKLHGQHEEILDALRDHDGERAERLVHQHFLDAVALAHTSAQPQSPSSQKRARIRPKPSAGVAAPRAGATSVLPPHAPIPSQPKIRGDTLVE